MSSTDADEKQSRRQQIVATYKMAKRSDTRIGLILAAAFLVGFLLGGALFWFLPGPDLVFGIIGGVVTGFLAVTVVFGRRAQKAAYDQMDGQLGSAAGALKTLRRGWKVDPAVGFTRQQDIVHRVVGPPGIILVGEGTGNRLRQLMTTERRRHERVVGDVPVTEIIVGDASGEVPLRRLVKHVSKLDKAVKPAEMTDILSRLRAVDAAKSNVPIPKGPVPTSMKGQRSQMRGRR